LNDPATHLGHVVAMPCVARNRTRWRHALFDHSGVYTAVEAVYGLRLDPGPPCHISGNGNRGNPDNHNGERFLMVLEGELKREYGDDLLLLGTGDIIYIYAAIPHVLMPAGRVGP